MSFPISIESTEHGFCAFVPGDRSVSGEGATRQEAVSALRAEIQVRLAHGDLILVDIEPLGVTQLAGAWADDPTVPELVDEIYRLRDEDRQRVIEEIDGRF
jgi:hypothetical protein